MNYGITPEQASQIVDRLANARNNPITAPSEATMPSNGQFFRMSEMAAPVDFMSDPRYQSIQVGQMYSPTIDRPQGQIQSDKYAKLGLFGDLFKVMENSNGFLPMGQLQNSTGFIVADQLKNKNVTK